MKTYNEWKDITYLRKGNGIQQKTYACLQDLRILEELKNYHPIVVGTIPINLQTEQSDIDIICEVHDFSEFAQKLLQSYGKKADFQISERIVLNVPRIKANFSHDGLELELFGQPVPTLQQNGFRHMIVEHRLLQMAGENAREDIRLLKKNGIKTEPAFAQYFHLEGDPYEALLDLFYKSDDELRTIVNRIINE